MFDDIEALEKEVDNFRKNILASQELISGIDKMISTQKAQSEEYSKSYGDMLEKLKDYAEKQKAEEEEFLAELTKKNESIINDVVSQLTTSQKENITELAEVEKSLNDCEAELALKYQQFVTKLESTNIDQIYSSVQELKRSINVKLAILFSCIGVSIVLGVLSLLLK